MAYILSLAWKNILRTPRRTILTFLMFTVSIALYIFMQGIFGGMEEMTARNYINFETGHLKVTSATYEDDGPFSINNFIANPEEVNRKLMNRSEIEASTLRIRFPGEADNGIDSVPCLVTGIDPVLDKRVFTLSNFIISGHNIEKAGDILIGMNLAKDLSLEKGTSFYFTFRNSHGTVDSVPLKVAGILNTPDPLINASGIYMSIEKAAKYLDTKSVTSIIIRLREMALTTKMKSVLTAALPGYKFVTWEEQAKDVLTLSRTKEKFIFLFVIALMIIGTVGIVNTMLISIFEKTKEIGMLKALGMRDTDILKLFLTEGVILGFLGGLLGVLFGGALNGWYAIHGLDFSSLIGKNMDLSAFRIQMIIYTKFAVGQLIGSVLLCAALGFLASWYPAKKALTMQAAECLRTI